MIIHTEQRMIAKTKSLDSSPHLASAAGRSVVPVDQDALFGHHGRLLLVQHPQLFRKRVRSRRRRRCCCCCCRRRRGCQGTRGPVLVSAVRASWPTLPPRRRPCPCFCVVRKVARSTMCGFEIISGGSVFGMLCSLCACRIHYNT